MDRKFNDVKVDISGLTLDAKSPKIMSAKESKKILAASANYIFGQREVRDALKELSSK
ncbi:hypothetical protein ACFQ44_13580 [Levilactobacillus lanxiensis]|uniref:Uncharacterized protein n=1 Tax=Levilactobacillus lanxiensis TaxID=2799568 RepID=A0ABW4D555_9LACO|nr:hypothetical protein [Levilactobacillus lanxiensis]